MSSATAKMFNTLIMPHGLLLIAVILYVHLGATPDSLSMIVPIYPAVVLGIGVLLGWRFNQSRLVFALLVLTLADRGLQYISSGEGAEAVGRVIFNAISLLLPINFALLSIMTERGILTLRGILRSSLILLQLPFIAFICYSRPQSVIAYLTYEFLDTHFLNFTAIPQPALLTMSFGLFFLLIRFFLFRKAMESGFSWALLTSFIALNHNKEEQIPTVYFATAGLILIIAVIETSYTMAYQDELTGLPGRHALKEDLLKLGSHYTVAMLDIDHFKMFNDRFGHDVGDQVLRMVASKLAKVSGGVKAFRYGGEEFTLLFPSRSLDEVSPHLEKLRKTIAASSFTLRGRKRPREKPKNLGPRSGAGKKLSITVSIGVAERDASHNQPEQVMKAADKALYRAKQEGRNRVSI